MRRIGIIAAMPGELKSLVKGWVRVPAEGQMVHWQKEGSGVEWIAACAGIGSDCASRAFAETEKGGPLAAVLSIGWAGALEEGFAGGTGWTVAEVIDARTSEHFFTAAAGGLKVVSSPIIARESEKRRLAKDYRASLVDMEGATVARLASARGIPFYSFKAVTDEVDANLPDFNRFVTRSGQMRIAALAIHCALRPWYWLALIRMGKNSRVASEELKLRVVAFLNEQM